MAVVSTFVTGKQATKTLGSQIVKQENYLDFSAINVVQNDVAKAITIPAGAIVLSVGVQTLTVEGADDLIQVGDSGSATQFIADIDPTVASNLSISALTTAKYYASADYVALKPTAGALTAMKCYVFATYIMAEKVS